MENPLLEVGVPVHWRSRHQCRVCTGGRQVQQKRGLREPCMASCSAAFSPARAAAATGGSRVTLGLVQRGDLAFRGDGGGVA